MSTTTSSIASAQSPVLSWHAPTYPPVAAAPDLGAEHHPSRAALELVLSDPDNQAAWTALGTAYDAMAADWSTWAASQPQYAVAVVAGLALARPCPWQLEIGCGTGQATVVLDALCAKVVAGDVNASMLAHAPALPRTTYLRVDVRRLPFADGSVPMIVGLNAVPHIAEFTRVLPPDGQLLWCSSFGPATPLYVAPARLLDLLGPGWCADAGRAGNGEWTLARRT